MHEVLHENGKVGRVTFFLKNEFIALVSYKTSRNYRYTTLKDCKVKKVVQQYGLDFNHDSLPHRWHKQNYNRRLWG
jgi:hypothetical protein